MCVGPLAPSMPDPPAAPDNAAQQRELERTAEEKKQRILNARRKGRLSLYNEETGPVGITDKATGVTDNRLG